ncbi:MAG: hypothetical protein ACK56I_22410, partial [bacterium]
QAQHQQLVPVFAHPPQLAVLRPRNQPVAARQLLDVAEEADLVAAGALVGRDMRGLLGGVVERVLGGAGAGAQVGGVAALEHQHPAVDGADAVRPPDLLVVAEDAPVRVARGLGPAALAAAAVDGDHAVQEGQADEVEVVDLVVA